MGLKKQRHSSSVGNSIYLAKLLENSSLANFNRKLTIKVRYPLIFLPLCYAICEKVFGFGLYQWLVAISDSCAKYTVVALLVEWAILLTLVSLPAIWILAHFKVLQTNIDSRINERKLAVWLYMNIWLILAFVFFIGLVGTGAYLWLCGQVKIMALTDVSISYHDQKTMGLALMVSGVFISGILTLIWSRQHQK